MWCVNVCIYIYIYISHLRTVVSYLLAILQEQRKDPQKANFTPTSSTFTTATTTITTTTGHGLGRNIHF